MATKIGINNRKEWEEEVVSLGEQNTTNILRIGELLVKLENMLVGEGLEYKTFASYIKTLSIPRSTCFTARKIAKDPMLQSALKENPAMTPSEAIRRVYSSTDKVRPTVSTSKRLLGLLKKYVPNMKGQELALFRRQAEEILGLVKA